VRAINGVARFHSGARVSVVAGYVHSLPDNRDTVCSQQLALLSLAADVLVRDDDVVDEPRYPSADARVTPTPTSE
jgi:hypothetical protein